MTQQNTDATNNNTETDATEFPYEPDGKMSGGTFDAMLEFMAKGAAQKRMRSSDAARLFAFLKFGGEAELLKDLFIVGMPYWQARSMGLGERWRTLRDYLAEQVSHTVRSSA